MRPPPNNDARVQGGRQLLRGGAGNDQQSTRRAPAFQEYGRRPPPAYQEYAADLLADRDFRSMSAAERGVLFTMRLECWCNKSVPSDPAALARVLGLDAGEIKAGLTQRVLRHFEAQKGTERVLVCPQLDAYRVRLDERYAKMSAGGRKGADQTNQSRRNRTTRRESGYPDSLHDGHPDAHPDGPLSTTKQSTTEPNPVYRVSGEHSEFIAALDGKAGFEP